MKLKNHDYGLFIARLGVAFTMLIYGTTKLVFGIDAIKILLHESGLPASLAYGVFIGEIAAPLLIMIGYRTRMVGLLFSFNCLVALILAQIPRLFTLNTSGGWALDLLFIYILFGIVLYFTGAGKLALSTKSKWD